MGDRMESILEYWLFTLVIARLTGSCEWLPLPSITTEYCNNILLAKEKNKNLKYSVYRRRIAFARS